LRENSLTYIQIAGSFFALPAVWFSKPWRNKCIKQCLVVKEQGERAKNRAKKGQHFDYEKNFSKNGKNFSKKY
jgi:hypothetical protein